MKPIDPNLNSNESEDILFNGGYDENKIIEVEQSSISNKTQNDIQTQTNELNKIVEKLLTKWSTDTITTITTIIHQAVSTVILIHTTRHIHQNITKVTSTNHQLQES